MDLYSKTLIKEIQNAVNTNRCEMQSYDKYESTFLGEYNVLYSNGIRMNFSVTNGHRDVVLYIYDPAIGNKYAVEWKATPAGKFLSKDWKKETMSSDGTIAYKGIAAKLASGATICGIVRECVELDTIEDEESKKDYKAKYCNVTIGGKWYSIIKLWDEDDQTKTVTIDTFGHHDGDELKEQISDDLVITPEVDDEAAAAEIPDTAQSGTLF